MAAQPGADNIPSFKVCILYLLLVLYVLKPLFWYCVLASHS